MEPEYAYRKRSSLKTKLSFSEHFLEEWNKPKKLQWDVQVQETDQQKNSETKLKFKEADTHYQEVDPGDDIYLQKINEINKITPTKEVIEEIVELVNEEFDKENTPREEVTSTTANTSDVNTNDSIGRFEFKRKSSIKDEFTLVKELLKQKKNDDELEPEIIEETMKNTLYNKCLGKIDDDSDSEHSE